jgi:hypothetical protein
MVAHDTPPAAAERTTPRQHNPVFSAGYTLTCGGTPHALYEGMKMTPTILKHITYQITHGNPLWGLAVANEYLSPGNPIHRALVLKASGRLKDSPSATSILFKLKGGARRAELSRALSSRIGTRETSEKACPERAHSACQRHYERRISSRGSLTGSSIRKRYGCRPNEIRRQRDSPLLPLKTLVVQHDKAIVRLR